MPHVFFSLNKAHTHTHQIEWMSRRYKEKWLFTWAMKKDLYSCLGYIGNYTTMLYGDYFINHSKASLYKHRVFYGRQIRVFISWLTYFWFHLLYWRVSWLCFHKGGVFFRKQTPITGWWFQIFFIFTPKGKISNLTSILFRWVGSTTN